ncbi:MAG: hypothetical protein U0169_17320 [Polyangiaceae bacterium]
MTSRSFVPFVALAALVAIACGGSGTSASKYPADKDGCAVQVFQDAPTMPTDNIGPVVAKCGEDISDDACLRTLQDQVCALGGNVVWQVEPKPTVKDGSKRWTGRAAHTR